MIAPGRPTTAALKRTARGVFRLRCLLRFVTVTPVASLIAAGGVTLPGFEDIFAEMTWG
jgi:hypothetical protein